MELQEYLDAVNSADNGTTVELSREVGEIKVLHFWHEAMGHNYYAVQIVSEVGVLVWDEVERDQEIFALSQARIYNGFEALIP